MLGVKDMLTDTYKYVAQRADVPKHVRDVLGATKAVFVTVEAAYEDDYTVDVTLGTPTPQGKKRTLYRRCLVVSPGGVPAAGQEWAELGLPLKNSQALALFVPGRTTPVVIGGLYFPDATIQKGMRGLIAELTDPGDRIATHPSGVKIKLLKDKTVEITQPAGAEVTISPAGEIHLKQKSGEKIKVGLTSTDKVVMEALLQTRWAAFKTWLSAHVHPTPAGPSGPPVSPAPPLPPTAIPDMTGAGSATVDGQP